jgi:iron(III) transport system substrate-binding protein
MNLPRHAALLAALISTGTAALAQTPVLNLYSARHYQTDEALYQQFTAKTGIRIQRVDADDAGILARLKAEGSASPADVVLLVDAARLWRAEVDGLFQPLRSATLEQRVPAQLRGTSSTTGPRSRSRTLTPTRSSLSLSTRAAYARARGRIPTTFPSSAR